MTRVKNASKARKRRKRVLRLAKGQRGARSRLYRTARESVQRSLAYSYRSRRTKKRIFRNLWIARINAACRRQTISYNSFIHGLKLAKVALDRKILADIAVNDPKAFAKLVELSKKAK